MWRVLRQTYRSVTIQGSLVQTTRIYYYFTATAVNATFPLMMLLATAAAATAIDDAAVDSTLSRATATILTSTIIFVAAVEK